MIRPPRPTAIGPADSGITAGTATASPTERTNAYQPYDRPQAVCVRSAGDGAEAYRRRGGGSAGRSGLAQRAELRLFRFPPGDRTKVSVRSAGDRAEPCRRRHGGSTGPTGLIQDADRYHLRFPPGKRAKTNENNDPAYPASSAPTPAAVKIYLQFVCQ